MVATVEVSPETNGTHADRPTPRVQLPFRFVPGTFPIIEWDQDVLLPDGKSKRCVAMHVRVEESAFGNQVGLKIRELMEMFHAEASRVDGLLAAIDQLTTENALLKGANDKLENQLTEARRSKNGKRE